MVYIVEVGREPQEKGSAQLIAEQVYTPSS